METYLSQQAMAFLWAVVLGAVLGAVNDCFRVGRILWRHGAFWVFLEDLLFSFIAAVLSAFCLTFTNYGQVRLFLLIGELLGFLLYFYTLGVFVTAVARLLSCILGAIGRLMKGIFRRFSKKIIKFVNFFKKPFIFLIQWFRIIMIEFERRKAKRGKESEKIKSRS